MSRKGPGSNPGKSFKCYQMNIKCPILTYEDENPCLPSLPSLPNRSFLDQLTAEIRELCSMALFNPIILPKNKWATPLKEEYRGLLS